MNLINRTGVYLVTAIAVSALTVGCAVDSYERGDDVAVKGQAIINGNVPTAGGLAGWGVVSLGGCTGTILDNWHVLTAHHCVRAYDDSTGVWGALTTGPVIVRYEDGGPQQTAAAAQIFEPATPWSLNAGDYAILALTVPIKVNDSATGYSRAIYASSDSTLANQDVFCVGYGGTVAATSTTFSSGFDTISSATMKITGTGSGVLTRPANSSGQVGFGGDSGSSCFLGSALVGVQSTCSGATWHDVNGNGVVDSWWERSAPTSCSGAAPSQFRTWAATQLAVAVNTNFAYSAALAGGVI